jgi:hypothetical protein
MAPTRPLGPAVKAEVTADLNGLPCTRISEERGTAYVFTRNLPDLELWFMALGGHIKPENGPTPGTTVWTLTTNTDHGHGVPVLVQTLGMATDQIDPACAAAVRRTARHHAGTDVPQ